MTMVYEDPGDETTDIPMRRIKFTVNGQKKIAEVEPRLLLSHLIRRGLGLTGTHMGCDTTNCGACTVLVDGRPVKSCTMLAVQVDGREISTVEGLATASELHPLQEGFKEEHGLQCGFCTPGMMLTARALLDRDPDPDENVIREAISGQICAWRWRYSASFPGSSLMTNLTRSIADLLGKEEAPEIKSRGPI